MKAAVVALVIALTAGPALAEKDIVPWYRGKYGRNRIVHLSITGVLGVSVFAFGKPLRPIFTASSCRWCTQPSFDRGTRNALVWKDTKRAGFLSSIDAYVVAPIVGLTLLVIADRDASASRLIDDILPVAETVAVAQLLVSWIKFGVARTRPYAYYNDLNGVAYQNNDTDLLSFPSGHASLGFAITASAGLICHWRHYWTEPYVWGTGIALSLSTEYLRMAADKHWLSDVVAGGGIGIAAGLLIPRLMRRDIQIAPVPGGAAVVGQF